MITSLGLPAGNCHGWHVSEFEHETRLGDGEVVDLKAYFGFDLASLGTDWFEIRMSRAPGASPVLLLWKDLEVLSVQTIAPLSPAEDGRIGIIGIRLLEQPHDTLQFEVELDWLRVTIVCKQFEVIG